MSTSPASLSSLLCPPLLSCRADSAHSWSLLWSPSQPPSPLPPPSFCLTANNSRSVWADRRPLMMAKNLSIRFNAASSATAISSAPSTTEDLPTDVFPSGTSTDTTGHLVETPVAVIANDAEIGRKSNQPVEETQWSTALGDSNSSLNSQCSTVLNDLYVPSPLPSSEKDEALNLSATKGRKGASPTVGAKVDKFMRQLHESLSPASASGSKGEAPSATTSWCKFDKAEGSLEIISSNQAESDDSMRERVSITLTPATSTSNQGTVGGGGKASTTSTANSWLADMKLFRDKWAKNNEKKANEEVYPGHGPVDSKRKLASSAVAGKMAGPAGGAVSSSSTVTVSNPYLNNNYLANHVGGGHTCGSCFRRNPNSGPQPQQQSSSSTSPSALPFYCGCTASRDADQSNSKCNTPQRSPTPPLLLSPSEVVFDPTLDPYLGAENSMLFSFKSSSSSDGKEKKEKKEKDVKKSKLFTGSSSSQSKEKDSVSARKKGKEEKKDREKESATFMTKLMNTSRSCSVSSSNAPLTPGSVSNSSNNLSFLAVGTPANTSPTQSHYSSTENISFTGDPSFQPTLINWTSGRNIPKNTAKLTTSRSMISFRKLKGDADEATLDDSESSILFHLGNDTRNSFAPTAAPTGNPTLRRKASFRRDSPTATECSNEDGLSVSSNQSSSASNGFEPAAPSLSPVDASVRRSEASVFSLHSRVFSSPSWAMCFSYAYYVFAFVVALLSLLISLISPLPSFFNGLVLGFVCTFLLVTVVIIYVVSNYVLIKAPDGEEHSSTAPDLTYFRRNKPKLSVNSLFNASTGPSDADSFSGWVYEFIGEYEEREKNGFVSQLVYLHLRGTKLTIFTPKEELNEKKLKQFVSENKLPSISSQRVVDFAKQSRRRIALLLTKNVRNQRKYIWSKKYPISVEFTDDRASCGGGYVVSGSNQATETPLDPESTRVPGHSPLALKFVFFGRSCKDKEEWFWAIKSAIEWNGSKSTEVSPKGSSLHIADETGDNSTEVALEAKESLMDAAGQSYLRILTSRQSYNAFMRTNVLNAETLSPNGLMSPLTWFNVLLNRLSFDILNKPNWSAYIAKKLQRKLRKLRLPYFMESLTITEIDIGTTLPKFNSVPSQPTVDEAGLWIDFDVNYSGGLTMTLETKLNLMKLKRRESPGSEAVSLSNLTESGLSTPISPLDSPVSNSRQQKHWSGYKCRAFTASSINSTGTGNDANEEFSLDDDSDLDSILTSSEDEEPETAPADPDDADTDVKQRKFIRFVDNIATSQWFQKATKMTFFQKAIEGVSKMSISMTVQINSLSGILAINIPQSPSDRLWYGFRNEPTIQITARPKLGDQHVNLQYLTNFIEKKLKAELFNYFVIPHMDDFYIPALNANIEQFISVVK